MPTLLTERVDSREWSGGSVTHHYTLTGTADDVAARDLLLAGTPGTYDGLVREQHPTLEPVWVDETSGDGQWDCTVRYNPPDVTDDSPSEIGSVRIRGTTKGGTEHVVASRATVGAYGTGAATGDNGKLIGVTSDNVEGVDLIAPVFNFSAVKVFASAGLPSLSAIFGLTAKVNQGGFSVTDTVTGLTISLAAGECLLLGVDFGDARADGGVEFAYDFAALPNRTGISVGDISGIAKTGWQYMWVRYEKAEIGGLKVIGQKPKAVYVEKVYEEGSFSGLGL